MDTPDDFEVAEAMLYIAEDSEVKTKEGKLKTTLSKYLEYLHDEDYLIDTFFTHLINLLVLVLLMGGYGVVIATLVFILASVTEYAYGCYISGKQDFLDSQSEDIGFK